MRNGNWVYKRGLLFLILILILTLGAALACSSSATATPAPTPTTAATAVPTPTQASSVTATTTPGAAQYGGVLKFAAYNIDLHNLDAMKMQFNGDADVDPQIYDHLIMLGTDFSLQPGLATSWDISSSGSDITFHLRQGVTFQDGTPFDAQAVKFTFDRVLDPSNNAYYNSSYTAILNSVEVVDNNTVTFHLKAPSRPFLGLIAAILQGGGIVSPTAVQKMGETAFNANGVGTGPFAFKSWTVDQELQLVKNSNYWQRGLPYLDGVNYFYVPDANTRLAMLQSGEADMTDQIDPTDVATIQNNPNVNIIKYASPVFHALQVNLAVKPWDSLQVRQALAYSLDRPTLIKTLLSGYGTPDYSPEGTQFWWSDPQITMYQYNPTMAKQLLTQAGYPNGVTVDYYTRADTQNISNAEVYQSMLANTGFHLNIVQEAPSNFTIMLDKAQLSFLATSWRPRPDPDGRLRILFASNGSYNWDGYNNPQVDQLLNEAAATYDESKAKTLYDQIQTTVVQDVAGYAYTYFQDLFTGLRKNVYGYRAYPDTNPRFAYMWMSQ